MSFVIAALNEFHERILSFFPDLSEEDYKLIIKCSQFFQKKFEIEALGKKFPFSVEFKEEYAMFGPGRYISWHSPLNVFAIAIVEGNFIRELEFCVGNLVLIPGEIELLDLMNFHIEVHQEYFIVEKRTRKDSEIEISVLHEENDDFLVTIRSSAPLDVNDFVFNENENIENAFLAIGRIMDEAYAAELKRNFYRIWEDNLIEKTRNILYDEFFEDYAGDILEFDDERQVPLKVRGNLANLALQNIREEEDMRRRKFL